MDQDLMRALMASGSFFQAFLDRDDKSTAALPGRRVLPVYQVAICFDEDEDEKTGGEKIWWESALSPR